MLKTTFAKLVFIALFIFSNQNLLKLNFLQENLKAYLPIEVDAFEVLLKNKSINAIDTRTMKNLYEQGLPPNAISVTQDTNYDTFASTIFSLNAVMIVIAEEGNETEVISKLSNAGFKNILGYLKGGINAWINKQKPIIKLNLITTDKAKEAAENGYVLDVRTPEEFKNPGHIKSSINIPLAELQDNLEKLDKSKKILVLCKSGIRATIGATILLKNGFHNDLAVLEGGITNLIEKGIVLEQ